MVPRVPPPSVRALVITPVVFVGALVVSLLSPVLHAVLALIDLVDRKNWRFTRIVGLGIAFCVVETIGLLLAFGLWVLAGFGIWLRSEWMQHLHQRVFGLWLELITSAIRVFLGFDFVFPDQQLPDGPVLVFSRHTGPGDALLVAHSLIRVHHRRVRMLGTTKLLWDPFFNHVVRRMPFHFCEEDPADPEKELQEVRMSAATIEEDGAMIIFPEGGNFTPGRKVESELRLRSRGQEAKAERASHMKHVLPPRTAGAVAALDAAPHASAVFLAHVGLDDLFSLSDLWHSVPLRRTVLATYWEADRDREAGPGRLGDWIWDQWERVDTWIDEHYDTAGAV